MEEKKQWLRNTWHRYQEGTASPEELAQLQDYLQQQAGPSLEALFGKDMEGEEQMPPEMASRMRMQLEQLGVPQEIKERKFRRTVRWLSAAAVFLAVTAGSYYLIEQKNSQPTSDLADNSFDSIVNLSQAARFIQLPDATKVWLNKGARLYIHKAYAQHRQVRLSGEAYFDVTKNAAHPMVVQTGNISTTVLGTGFNIDYSHAAVRVSLVQGSVQVNKNGTASSPVLLSPGETAVAGARDTGITRGKTGVADVAGWIKGNLVLNQLSLSEALLKTGAYYGLTIRADEALLQDKMVNTIYYKHQNWQQVLHHLLFMYRLTYTSSSNHEIVITKQ